MTFEENTIVEINGHKYFVVPVSGGIIASTLDSESGVCLAEPKEITLRKVEGHQ